MLITSCLLCGVALIAQISLRLSQIQFEQMGTNTHIVWIGLTITHVAESETTLMNRCFFFCSFAAPHMSNIRLAWSQPLNHRLPSSRICSAVWSETKCPFSLVIRLQTGDSRFAVVVTYCNKSPFEEAVNSLVFTPNFFHLQCWIQNASTHYFSLSDGFVSW